jgi:hypothetical protein
MNLSEMHVKLLSKPRELQVGKMAKMLWSKDEDILQLPKKKLNC